MIVIGILIQSDATLMRDYFNEMAHLIGVKVRYYSPTSVSYDNYGIQDLMHDKGIWLDIIFEESPSIRTIKKLGWYKNDNDNLPIIAHVPYDTPNLQKGSYIGIFPDFSLGESEEEILEDNVDFKSMRLFKITVISSIQIYPASWSCQLAPVIESERVETSSEDNFSYVGIDNFDQVVDNLDNLEGEDSGTSD